MANKFLKFEKLVALLFIFLLPSQLALHLWPSWAFVFGIRIDYLAPTIYLTDLLVFLLLSLWVFQDFKTIKNLVVKNKYFLASLFLLIILNCLFSVSVFPTILKWLKIIELLVLGIYFSQRIKILDRESILKTLFISLTIFSSIGIAQFLIGHTVGGLLYWMGERNFTLSSPGIALTHMGGENYLRAYSTFPHPNSIAGYIGVSVILLFVGNFFKNSKIKLVGLLIIGLCFLLTFSMSAFLAGVVVLLLFFLKNREVLFRKSIILIFSLVVIASLSLPVISQKVLTGVNFSKNISERLDLSVISGQIIAKHFWTGTGLNTFTISMTKVRPNLTSSWLLQPVHNIFLLAFSEVGILGILLLCFYFYPLLSYKSDKGFQLVFLFIVITGFFDHYWLTIHQNLLLLSVVSGIVIKPKK